MSERAMELMGELTMCWSPIPTGVFESEKALKIINEAFALIWAEGFDAGERDVFEHDRTGWNDSPCIPNPHRGEANV